MKEIIKALEKMGFIERKFSEYENSFYGKQTWVSVTPLGNENGLKIFRSGKDIWPGEVVPIKYIQLGDECLYERE
jgi:hypothetical protein